MLHPEHCIDKQKCKHSVSILHLIQWHNKVGRTQYYSSKSTTLLRN
jgi:hypothetical protein